MAKRGQGKAKETPPRRTQFQRGVEALAQLRPTVQTVDLAWGQGLHELVEVRGPGGLDGEGSWVCLSAVGARVVG